MFMAQICDFGLAKWNDYSQTISSHRKRRGTVTHIPPESWSDSSQPRTVKYDVYSFAVLLWELFTEEKPFENGIISDYSVDNRLLITMKILFGFKSEL